MGTRQAGNLVIGAVIALCASLGVPEVTAAPHGSADAETGPGVAAPATATPGHRTAGGDDLIYDFVGPNTTDGPKKREPT